LRKRIAGHEDLKTAQERFRARKIESGQCTYGYKGCQLVRVEGKRACVPCKAWQREYYLRRKALSGKTQD